MGEEEMIKMHNIYPCTLHYLDILCLESTRDGMLSQGSC